MIRRNNRWIGMGLILIFLVAGSASALVEISKKAEVRADQDDIDAILDTFDQLVLEEGEWRMIGHDPSEKERDLFGSAIHLLF